LLTEDIIWKLRNYGCIEVVCRSKKYRQFQIPNSYNYFFVGNKGALRIGRVSAKARRVRFKNGNRV